ncbi:MAG: hypothetical protein IPM48_15040 [Saprospiraceae bacterium]|nr:hypothetical protein [Saprospiraceae bacterium]
MKNPKGEIKTLDDLFFKADMHGAILCYWNGMMFSVKKLGKEGGEKTGHIPPKQNDK